VFSESLTEQKVISLDLKTDRESVTDENCLWQRVPESRQTVLKTGKHVGLRLRKSVLVNGWSSSGTADERKVRLQARSAIRRCR